METSTIIWSILGIVLVIAGFYSIKSWIIVYNKFVYWITRANRKFADIDVIMQQRIDMIRALAQIVKKYDIHEWKALKDTIEARSRWTKDAPLNEKIKAAQEIENNFIKIQAVFERYPKLKASSLHKSIMGHGNVSRVESKLREVRLGYNKIAQQYNERVKRFPRSIVAWLHGFSPLPYITLPNQETYNPKQIFED